ncbi:hypothetical protein CRG98_015305, partial [Punica granatum]
MARSAKMVDCDSAIKDNAEHRTTYGTHFVFVCSRSHPASDDACSPPPPPLTPPDPSSPDSPRSIVALSPPLTVTSHLPQIHHLPLLLSLVAALKNRKRPIRTAASLFNLCVYNWERMLTCIACSKQQQQRLNDGSLHQQDDEDAAATPRTKQAIKALTSQ